MSDREQSSGNTGFEKPQALDSTENESICENNEHSRHSQESLCKIYTAGKNNEYIYIGRQKFLRDDLAVAFGGTLNPGLAPAPVHKFANPAPLGLSGFALTTFVLSLCNARAQGVTTPNVVVGLSLIHIS